MLSILKKCLSIVLILTMLFSVLIINCSATNIEENENQIMPRWSIINSVGTSFTISGIVATASVVLTSKMTVNLMIKVELQKETSSGYETVETWSAFETNGTMLGLEETKVINIFADYRMKVTCIAGNEQHVTYDYP